MYDDSGSKKPFVFSIVILLVGVILFILAYVIDTYPDQYLESILFFISLPLIGLGFVGFIYQLKLTTACLVEGVMALVIPLLMTCMFIVISSGWRIILMVLLLIILVGITSLILGIYGFLKSKKGLIRIGQRIRILLYITLAIGILLSYAVVHPGGI
jgi:hypothetical protein